MCVTVDVWQAVQVSVCVRLFNFVPSVTVKGCQVCVFAPPPLGALGSPGLQSDLGQKYSLSHRSLPLTCGKLTEWIDAGGPPLKGPPAGLG